MNGIIKTRKNLFQKMKYRVLSLDASRLADL